MIETTGYYYMERHSTFVGNGQLVLLVHRWWLIPHVARTATRFEGGENASETRFPAKGHYLPWGSVTSVLATTTKPVREGPSKQ